MKPDPDAWWRISMKLLDLVLEQGKPVKWLHTHAKDAGYLSLYEELRQIEEIHKVQVDRAIQEWKIGSSIDRPPGLASAIIDARLLTAHAHASSLSVIGSDMAAAVFTPPLVDDESVIKFLMTDWWYLHGQLAFAIVQMKP